MSIQAALITASSSLAMQQEQANVIAGNVANANTPGYVAETLQQLEHLYGTRTGVEGGTLQRLGNETAEAAANQTAGQ
jgi:flagellar hook-associated protein FlgK